MIVLRSVCKGFCDVLVLNGVSSEKMFGKLQKEDDNEKRTY
jgi:hypothetical protein